MLKLIFLFIKNKFKKTFNILKINFKNIKNKFKDKTNKTKNMFDFMVEILRIDSACFRIDFDLFHLLLNNLPLLYRIDSI